MRKLAVLVVLVALAVPVGASGEPWEYKVVEVDLITKVRVFANDLLLSGDELEQILAPLGAEGWELMGSVSRGGTSLLLVFKRPELPPIQTRPGQPPGPSPDKGGAVPAPVGEGAPTAPPPADPATAETAPPEPAPAETGEAP